MNCFCIVPFTISTRPENICKILPETQSEKCLHNLGPPRLAYISGRSNKMCPRPGITLGLIIQNCHKAIATKKRIIYLPTFYLELLARCRLLLQSLVSTAVLQSAITKIVIRHHPSHGASGGIMLHRHRLHWHLTMPLLSLLVSPSALFRQYSRDPPQHNSNPIKITTLAAAQ